MQLGVSSYAFGWAVGVRGFPPPCPFTEDDLLAFAAAQNLSLVQFGDHVPLHEFDAARLTRMHETARAAGIALETGARGLAAEHLAAYVRVSQDLDARLLRFVIDGRTYTPSADTVVGLLRDAEPLLAGANLTLGLENHDRFPARQLRQIIEQVGSARVGICLDTANSLGAGKGLATVLDQLAPHTVNLHVKDFAIARFSYGMGFTVVGSPAGQGMLDIVTLRDTIARHGRCRAAVLETWVPPEPVIEDTIAKERQWAEASLAYLRPRFAR